MTTLREAAQQALEALKKYRHMMFVEAGCRFGDGDAAIDALRAALEQKPLEPDIAKIVNDNLWNLYVEEPEQEPIIESEITPDKDGPVAVLLEYENGERELRFKNNGWPAKETPLFTHPPRREWRGLKEWEINDGLDQLPTEDVCSWSFRKGVYFAEAALKEKNHE